MYQAYYCRRHKKQQIGSWSLQRQCCLCSKGCKTFWKSCWKGQKKVTVKLQVIKKVGVTQKQVNKAIEKKKVIVHKSGKVSVACTEHHKKHHKKVVDTVVVKKDNIKVVHHKKDHKKVVVDKVVVIDKKISEEEKKHKLLKAEIHHHAKECACENSKTAEEKAICKEECRIRKQHLNQKVSDHVSNPTACEEKAVLACGNTETKECHKCKKSFIILCVQEENKRRSELVTLLDECDSFLIDSDDEYRAIVYRPWITSFLLK